MSLVPSAYALPIPVASSEDAGDSAAQEEGDSPYIRRSFHLQLCSEASSLVPPSLKSSLSKKVVTRAPVWINIAVDKVPSELSCRQPLFMKTIGFYYHWNAVPVQ